MHNMHISCIILQGINGGNGKRWCYFNFMYSFKVNNAVASVKYVSHGFFIYERHTHKNATHIHSSAFYNFNFCRDTLNANASDLKKKRKKSRMSSTRLVGDLVQP